MTPTTLALVDSNKLSREGLKALFADGDFEIVADGSNLDAIFTGVSDGKLDILLVDRACMRDLPQDIAGLKARLPGVRIVLLAGQLSMSDLSAAVQGGADGILMKNISLQALAQSLRLVRTGEKVFPTQLATMLVESGGSTGEPLPGLSVSRKGLSQREVQIIRLLMRGDSNKSIANELHITEATVKVHLKSLLRKINAANRTQAAIWGLNHGMAEVPQEEGRVG